MCIIWGNSESNLYDMLDKNSFRDKTAKKNVLGGVFGQFRHVQGLVNDALAGKSGVAVEQNGHGLFALGIASVELLSLDFALDHGIHGLQM